MWLVESHGAAEEASLGSAGVHFLDAKALAQPHCFSFVFITLLLL